MRGSVVASTPGLLVEQDIKLILLAPATARSNDDGRDGGGNRPRTDDRRSATARG